MMPAVQQARERSRQAACTNNLRQLGAAMHQFESARGRFPPVKADLHPVFPPPAPRLVNPVSPHYWLLPYLDLAVLHDEVQLVGELWEIPPPAGSRNAAVLQHEIAVFLCPSDGGVPGATSYPMCAGTSPNLHRTLDVPPPNSARHGMASGRRAADVTDGLSHSAAFSERLLGDRDASHYSPDRDIAAMPSCGLRLPDDVVNACQNLVTTTSPHFSGTGIGWLFKNYGLTLYNHVLTPNSRTPDCQCNGLPGGTGGNGAYSARSLHPGGVFVLYGDGAVRFVSENIDLTVWRASATIDAGD
jgi:hypothetical protein